MLSRRIMKSVLAEGAPVTTGKIRWRCDFSVRHGCHPERSEGPLGPRERSLATLGMAPKSVASRLSVDGRARDTHQLRPFRLLGGDESSEFLGCAAHGVRALLAKTRPHFLAAND